jgi:hypothetical protein
MKRVTLLLLASLLAGAAGAQTAQQYTYTQLPAGNRTLALGYPVPLPIASLTPVDGFRDYASLEARLQSLALAHGEISAHAVGNSIHGRTVWAYAVGGDSLDVEGRTRAAFFINATTHAREWGAPEVATGLVERLAAGAGDQGLVRYLLDNTRLVVIPVQNVDGLLQTQRFPASVLIGQDPCSPSTWPRDGRMRRKNMRGADELLGTLGDHLLGTDLNRNHPPLWRTAVFSTGCGSGSSNNPNSLVHHGAGAHSEPENQALRQAAMLAPVSRLRLGIDVHSFSRVFFSSNTGRVRLNQIQSRLLGVLSAHHAQQPTHDRVVNGAVYRDVPDPPFSGIGAAAEYFAYEWLVPAWTLELEPANGAQEYGGSGVSHDGFILPASQARRVREAWAESHLVAFYFMAGPPHLAGLRLRDAASGTLLREHRWEYDAQTQQRVLRRSGRGRIMPGQALLAELSFSKPMRHRVEGQIAALPGQALPAPPSVVRVNGSERTALDTAGGVWLGPDGLRYNDDSFAFAFTAPASGAAFTLEVDARDMVGLALDADPASPVDWQSGAWTGWQDAAGLEGDLGGADARTAQVSVALSNADIHVAAIVPQVGEGDRLPLRLRLDTPSAETITLIAESPEVYRDRVPLDPPPPMAVWAPGESGERLLAVTVADDTVVQGDRAATISLSLVTGSDVMLFTELEVDVLDNDRPGRAVLREHGALLAASRSAADVDGQLELVLDRGNYHLLAPGSARPDARWHVEGQLMVHGNGAVLAASGPADAACSGHDFIEVAGGASLLLDRIELRPATTQDRCGIRNTGRLELRRSRLHDLQPEDGYTLDSSGELLITRSTLARSGSGPATLRVTGGRADVIDSVLRGPGPLDGGSGVAALISGGNLDLVRSTVAGLPAVAGEGGAAARMGGSVLYERFQSLIMPPPFDRGACAAAAVISTGDNLYAASYDGGSVSSLEQSGCIQPAAGDRFANERWPGLESASDPDPTPPPGSSAIDALGSCAAIDLHGRPRPQHSGASVACERGAVELGINPYRGLWIPDRPGHGIDLQSASNQLSLIWYAYTDDGQPIAYQAAAPMTGTHWQSTLYTARREPDGAIVVSAVGEVGIDFDSNTEARLSWRFAGRSAGSEQIRALLFAEGEPRVEVTGSWYPPAESGNGASIARLGEVTAALLYFYDAAGTLRWALGTGDGADAVEIEMRGYTGFCPDCDAEAMPVSSQPIGRVLLHFLTPQRLRVDSDLVYPGPAGGRWLRHNADFVPLNDPVDNRQTLAPGGGD